MIPADRLPNDNFRQEINPNSNYYSNQTDINNMDKYNSNQKKNNNQYQFQLQKPQFNNPFLLAESQIEQKQQNQQQQNQRLQTKENEDQSSGSSQKKKTVQFQNKDQLNQQHEFTMNIDIAKGKQAKLYVFKNSDPMKLATQFVEKYGLKEEIIKPVAHGIQLELTKRKTKKQVQQKKIKNQIQEEEQEVTQYQPNKKKQEEISSKQTLGKDTTDDTDQEIQLQQQQQRLKQKQNQQENILTVSGMQIPESERKLLDQQLKNQNQKQSNRPLTPNRRNQTPRAQIDLFQNQNQQKIKPILKSPSQGQLLQNQNQNSQRNQYQYQTQNQSNPSQILDNNINHQQQSTPIQSYRSNQYNNLQQTPELQKKRSLSRKKKIFDEVVLSDDQKQFLTQSQRKIQVLDSNRSQNQQNQQQFQNDNKPVLVLMYPRNDQIKSQQRIQTEPSSQNSYIQQQPFNQNQQQRSPYNPQFNSFQQQSPFKQQNIQTSNFQSFQQPASFAQFFKNQNQNNNGNINQNQQNENQQQKQQVLQQQQQQQLNPSQSQPFLQFKDSQNQSKLQSRSKSPSNKLDIQNTQQSYDQNLNKNKISEILSKKQQIQQQNPQSLFQQQPQQIQNSQQIFNSQNNIPNFIYQQQKQQNNQNNNNNNNNNNNKNKNLSSFQLFQMMKSIFEKLDLGKKGYLDKDNINFQDFDIKTNEAVQEIVTYSIQQGNKSINFDQFFEYAETKDLIQTLIQNA